MARVLMLLSNPFSPDPRVHREAHWLQTGGHEVTILCWDRDGGSPEREIQDNIHLLRVGPRSSWGRARAMVRDLPRFWLQARKAVAKERFDAIHAHDLDTLPLGVLMASARGIPLIYDAHEDYAAMVAPTVGNLLARAIRALETFLVSFTSAVVTVSPPFGRRYRAMGAEPVALVMGCPAPAEAPDEDSAQLLRESLGAGDRIVLVYIGVLEPQRFLMEVAQEVAAHPDELFLVLGGYGSLEARLRAALPPGSSRILGRLTPAEVLAWSRAGDVVMAVYDPGNDNNRRSLPNKLFEAALVGRPFLAARGSVAARLAARDGFGIPIDYSHPHSLIPLLNETIGNPARKQEMCAAATRAGQTTFNGTVMGEKLRRLYRTILVQGR